MKRNKPDANQKEIVDALEDLGVVVFKIGQPLDLLLGYDGMLQLQEVKNPEGENKVSESQQKTINDLRAVGVYVPVVRSVEDSVLGIGGVVASLYKLRQRLKHLHDVTGMKWREIGEMEEFNGVSYGTLNGVYNGRVPKDDDIRARLGLK